MCKRMWSRVADSNLCWPCLSTALTTYCKCNCHVQVSHHPPVGVGHGENDNWTYDIVSAPSTKFLGNSVEIYPVGEPMLSA